MNMRNGTDCEDPLSGPCQIASNQGIPQAQTMLGIMLQDGNSIPKDLKRAAKLFASATSAGMTHNIHHARGGLRGLRAEKGGRREV
jgi:TPR repeat protein